MRAIKMLEYIKYFTLRRYFTSNVQLVGFNGPGEAGNYIAKDTLLEMPEKISFTCRMFQLNWSQFYFNNDSNKYLFFNFSKNSSGGLMSEDVYRDLTFYGTQYRRYLFYSEYYNQKKINDPNAVMQWANDYDTLSYIEEHGESFYPMSMVISIKDEDKEKFEQFMKMDYTSWTINFDWQFRQFWYNGEPTLFDKYPPEVMVDYLSKNIDAGNIDSSNIIYLLEYIIDYWYSANAYGHLSANRKTEIFFSILKLIKKEDAKDVYDKFFISPSYLYYTSVLDKLDSDAKVQFTFLLIKLFYMQMSEEDTIVYVNQIKNLPKDHIVPFIHEEAFYSSTGYVKKGPYPIYETTNDGLLIKKINFWVYKNENNRLATDEENIFNYIDNKSYAYDEIIGALCCFNREDLGLMQFMIYPIPAFAFPVFDKELSTNLTIFDLIDLIGGAIGIISPFFKIVQAEAIISNAASIIIGLTGIGLSSLKLEDELKKTGPGMAFLYMYHSVSVFWGGKDIVSAFDSAIRKNKIKGLLDFENLLTTWSTFRETNSFDEINNMSIQKFEEIKSEMSKIEIKYENYK